MMPWRLIAANFCIHLTHAFSILVQTISLNNFTSLFVSHASVRVNIVSPVLCFLSSIRSLNSQNIKLFSSIQVNNLRRGTLLCLHLNDEKGYFIPWKFHGRERVYNKITRHIYASSAKCCVCLPTCKLSIFIYSYYLKRQKNRVLNLNINWGETPGLHIWGAGDSLWILNAELVSLRDYFHIGIIYIQQHWAANCICIPAGPSPKWLLLLHGIFTQDYRSDTCLYNNYNSKYWMS